jgi:diaminopimelate decarboxylase
MHVAVSVVDVKNQQCVITDGGTNIVGFERFEFDYFPVINLTHPSLTERDTTVYGSLCMPQDYWGKRAFSGDFSENDIIIIPYQGALTYSNMNDFIKGKAPVILLES